SLIIYFALVGILLCPYNCAVRAAGKRAPVNEAIADACCEHCRAREVAKHPSAPKGSTPTRDGRSCICAGAVFNVSPRTVVDTLLFASHAPPAVNSWACLEMPTTARLAGQAAGPPLAPDG